MAVSMFRKVGVVGMNAGVVRAFDLSAEKIERERGGIASAPNLYRVAQYDSYCDELHAFVLYLELVILFCPLCAPEIAVLLLWVQFVLFWFCL